MKLVFPNGEHGQVLLSAGVNRIGTAPACAVVLGGADIQPVHCEIHLTPVGANLQVPQGGGAVLLNGKPVSDLMALRSGDRIDVGGIEIVLATIQAARTASSPVPARDDVDDVGATRVRTVIPRFVLRGVSGAVFGKVYPVSGPVVIGRSPDCDITVHLDEISRRHALLKPVGDGVSVEDLESANGTYINALRVQHGFLGPGDELRLDTLRFQLVAPGIEAAQQPRHAASDDPPVPRMRLRRWAAVAVAAAAVLAAAFALVPA